MKNNIPVLFVVCLVASICFAHSCADKLATPTNQIKYINVLDTTKVNELMNVLQLTRDSLNAYKNDTIMSEDEFILRFKLERIRYYNECAGKGNNIKFLRGWINRVLNE